MPVIDEQVMDCALDLYRGGHAEYVLTERGKETNPEEQARCAAHMTLHIFGVIKGEQPTPDASQTDEAELASLIIKLTNKEL